MGLKIDNIRERLDQYSTQRLRLGNMEKIFRSMILPPLKQISDDQSGYFQV